MNRLKAERSPYLKYHSTNPVEWYPWGKEAIESAKSLGRPLFVSIGYFSCHWCHRMNHDIFMDAEVAEAMNRAFVNVLVDREERPDVDSYFMGIAQTMTENVGWPLNVLSTTDLKPFFVFTYMPKHSYGNQLGIMELIDAVSALWLNDRGKLLSETPLAKPQDTVSPSEIQLHETCTTIMKLYDEKNGGFGSSPKFPMPIWIMLLQYYGWKNNSVEANYACQNTLLKIKKGGIYDQVGNGFHRYSTDSEWTLPHFEKMLYDQALLTIVYADSYRLSGIKLFSETVDGIISYLKDSLMSRFGGFYSAQDSDSGGAEGGYYLWTLDELENALPHDMLKDFLSYMAQKVSRDKYVIVDRVPEGWEGWKRECLRCLARERAKRKRPAIDEKVLVDWNGIMLAALSRAYKATGNEEYLNLAISTANFMDKMNESRVYHSVVGSEPTIEGFLDDYADLAWGYLELYGSTLNDRYFDRAKEICDRAMNEFSSDGPFYYSAKASDSPARMMILNDTVTPCGNSVMIPNLLELSVVTGYKKYDDALKRLSKSMAHALAENSLPSAMGAMWLDISSEGLREIIISSDNTNDAKEVIDNLRLYLPDVRVYWASGSMGEWLNSYDKGGKGLTIYLCSNGKCSLPMHNLDPLMKELKA